MSWFKGRGSSSSAPGLARCWASASCDFYLATKPACSGWSYRSDLAVLFALGSGIAKGIVSIIVLALGALAGGAIVMALLDLFGLDLGLAGWLLALIGAVAGAILFSRFQDWAIIILASTVGTLLIIRGIQMLIPSMEGFIASLIGLVLAGGGIAYHAGLFSKGKPKK